MTRFLPALAVIAIALGSSGCLVKKTTHRLYLSSSGSVLWSVLEEGVRSDDAEPAEQAREEREWLDALAVTAHPVAEGLRQLEAEAIATRVLRSHRPYMALTEARFPRVDQLIDRWLAELGLRGTATLGANDHYVTLSVSVDLHGPGQSDPETESAVAALIEELDNYRFLLTDGRFVAATGFDIHDGGTLSDPSRDPRRDDRGRRDADAAARMAAVKPTCSLSRGEPRVDVSLRQPPPIHHDAGDPRTVRDVRQRVGVEQDEIGSLAGGDRSDGRLRAEVDPDVGGPTLQRLVRRQPGGDDRAELAMRREPRHVPGLRRVGSQRERDAAVVQRLDQFPAQRQQLLAIGLRILRDKPLLLGDPLRQDSGLARTASRAISPSPAGPRRSAS